MAPSKLDCKISRRAQSAVKRKNPTPSVGNRVEHFFGILTSEFRVFYLYLLFFQFIYFSCVPCFSNFVFRVSVFRRSGVPAFQPSGVPYCSTTIRHWLLKFLKQNNHAIHDPLLERVELQ